MKTSSKKSRDLGYHFGQVLLEKTRGVTLPSPPPSQSDAAVPNSKVEIGLISHEKRGKALSSSQK